MRSDELSRTTFPGLRYEVTEVRGTTKGKLKGKEKVELTKAAQQAVQLVREKLATGGLRIAHFDTSDRRIFIQSDAASNGWSAIFMQAKAGIIHVDGGTFTPSKAVGALRTSKSWPLRKL